MRSNAVPQLINDWLSLMLLLFTQRPDSDTTSVQVVTDETLEGVRERAASITIAEGNEDDGANSLMADGGVREVRNLDSTALVTWASGTTMLWVELNGLGADNVESILADALAVEPSMTRE